ncbi:YbgA family protein [Candidatus Cloacimonadota bacterium]
MIDKSFPRPRIVVSKCIEFDSCRYNGLMIASPVVRKLEDFVDFIPVCPEVEIGLGTPREAVRLVKDGTQIKMVKSLSGDDHTKAMQDFSNKFLEGMKDLDGFILKSRSPSCGIKDVKLYTDIGKIPAINTKNMGMFGQAVLDRYGFLAIEDEGRLTNLQIREHFLTKLFTLTSFRKLEKIMKTLVEFHSNNKYLFMAYNQTQLKIAGKIVANHHKLPVDQVFEQYQKVLYSIFKNGAGLKSNINVLMHILGYFSKDLKAAEKAHFLDQLELFRARQIPLIGVTSVLQSWVIRFEQKYLADQTYFEPFPKELMHVADTGKGRIIK